MIRQLDSLRAAILAIVEADRRANSSPTTPSASSVSVAGSDTCRRKNEKPEHVTRGYIMAGCN
jgi:hypothetical protein